MTDDEKTVEHTRTEVEEPPNIPSAKPQEYKRRETGHKNRCKEAFEVWYIVVCQLLACIAFALGIIYGVNGYKALDGTSGSHYSDGKYVLSSSDIQTLIGLGDTIIGFLISAWSGNVIIRCVFAELEGNNGLTVKQFNRMASWPNIPPLSFKGRNPVIILILLLTLPQSYISILVTGSVNWGSALAANGTTQVASGNPAADYNLWGWYGEKLQDRQAAVKRAAGLANLAWATTNGDNSGAAQTRCRHVVNNDQIPVNSTLSDVTIPCLVFGNIDWPTTKSVPELVMNVANDSSQISLTAGDQGGPFSYVDYPGNAVLFDQSDTTLVLPYADQLANQNYWAHYGDPTPPASFMFSGKMTVIILTGKDYVGPPYFIDGFGYSRPNNNFTTVSSGDENHFTYLEVNFTVGVITPPSSTYISSQVVEGDQEPQEADIVAGQWVHEALYLLPDVMSTVAIMNSTSLNTWDNIFNYTENLIRYSYQGAWDMLQRNYDPNTKMLVATIEDYRVQASVTLIRVYTWLALSIVMTLSSAVLLRQLTTKSCERNNIIDGPLALLLTDPTAVFEKINRDPPKENQHLSNLAVLTKKEEEIRLKLQQEKVGDVDTGIFRLR